ncbi:MAG TPA: hypothetical protein DIC59_15585, partial [Candidatus Competibacteraceae bacterium]|nr:hypothetical protein [Candidatus Competibacteraceae bacterium]
EVVDAGQGVRVFGAELLLGEPVSLLGGHFGCTIVTFLKKPDNMFVKCIHNFLFLRHLSGFLLQIGSNRLDIVFTFRLLGMSDSAQAQPSR